MRTQRNRPKDIDTCINHCDLFMYFCYSFVLAKMGILIKVIDILQLNAKVVVVVVLVVMSADDGDDNDGRAAADDDNGDGGSSAGGGPMLHSRAEQASQST